MCMWVGVYVDVVCLFVYPYYPLTRLNLLRRLLCPFCLLCLLFFSVPLSFSVFSSSLSLYPSLLLCLLCLLRLLCPSIKSQEDFEYADTSAAYALEIEKSVRQAIKDAYRRWRSRRQRSTTTFHPDACSTMHDLLPAMENFKKSGALPSERTSTIVRRDRSASGKDRGGNRNSNSTVAVL